MQTWHDQYVSWAGEFTEGIKTQNVFVQCNAGRHLTVIFEVHIHAVEDFYGLADAFRFFAARVAEGGVREQCHAWFAAHAAGFLSRAHSDFRQLLWVW